MHSLIGLVAVLRTVAALSTSNVVESLRGVPQGWKQVGRPNPDTRFHLRIALDQPNHALFEQTLYDISTPDHSQYGMHLKREEIKALIKPRDESTDAVLSWLEESGVAQSDIENDGEWINFYTTVATAEAMMDTKFYYYSKTTKESAKKIRTLHYSVPQNVSSHITTIQPTTRFGQYRAAANAVFETEVANFVPKAADIPSTSLNVTACNATITPECIRALYNIGDYVADPECGSLLGVSGYLNEYAKYDALDKFLETYAPYAVSQNFSFVLVNGGLDTQDDVVDDDVEANLDIQYAASIAYKTDINYYSVGGLGELVPDLDQPSLEDNQNEPYLDFLNYLLKVPDHELPQTLTTSYGEDEQSVPEAYSRTVCNMFGQLGLRGVSVLFSSGDTGVGSACQTNDGKNTTRFLPIFPAACPYVTSVGGTYGVEPEKAIYFSSGGFSDRFPRPAYQKSAVDDYLNILGDRWDGLYNPAGRGFPDVAAQGYRFHVVDKNTTTLELGDILVGGTSASAPTFAAIVSLLNNARLSANKKPLGFLNPWLYSHGKKGLTDIVNGGSTGCTGRDVYSGLPTPFVPYASWNATKGWDPVTGLGTPDFEELLKLSGGKKLGHLGGGKQ
ncbi:Pro-kumamolisin [Phlyctema vagabunda]|uniref:Pro-kumamolisin n=1 Tax=Phlyctema vagabunda TaxID=108571 RepID=A0ABR4PMM4_9HELO